MNEIIEVSSFDINSPPKTKSKAKKREKRKKSEVGSDILSEGTEDLTKSGVTTDSQEGSLESSLSLLSTPEKEGSSPRGSKFSKLGKRLGRPPKGQSQNSPDAKGKQRQDSVEKSNAVSTEIEGSLSPAREKKGLGRRSKSNSPIKGETTNRNINESDFPKAKSPKGRKKKSIIDQSDTKIEESSVDVLPSESITTTTTVTTTVSPTKEAVATPGPKKRGGRKSKSQSNALVSLDENVMDLTSPTPRTDELAVSFPNTSEELRMDSTSSVSSPAVHVGDLSVVHVLKKKRRQSVKEQKRKLDSKLELQRRKEALEQEIAMLGKPDKEKEDEHIGSSTDSGKGKRVLRATPQREPSTGVKIVGSVENDIIDSVVSNMCSPVELNISSSSFKKRKLSTEDTKQLKKERRSSKQVSGKKKRSRKQDLKSGDDDEVSIIDVKSQPKSPYDFVSTSFSAEHNDRSKGPMRALVWAPPPVTSDFKGNMAHAPMGNDAGSSTHNSDAASSCGSVFGMDEHLKKDGKVGKNRRQSLSKQIAHQSKLDFQKRKEALEKEVAEALLNMQTGGAAVSDPQVGVCNAKTKVKKRVSSGAGSNVWDSKDNLTEDSSLVIDVRDNDRKPTGVPSVVKKRRNKPGMGGDKSVGSKKAVAKKVNKELNGPSLRVVRGKVKFYRNGVQEKVDQDPKTKVCN